MMGGGYLIITKGIPVKRGVNEISSLGKEFSLFTLIVKPTHLQRLRGTL
jgi:hypothetical protein